MATVTAIEPSADLPGHMVVRVDGRVFATVPVALLDRLGLSVGASINVHLAIPHVAIPHLATPDGEGHPPPVGAAKTYQRALGLLAYRARSARELRRSLLDKGESAEDVDAAITRLQSAGLVDDAAYARSMARVQVSGRARSVRRAEDDLRRRGVAPAVAAEAVRAVLVDEGTDERAVAVRAAVKKLRALAGMDPRAQRQKLYAYLARQGYSVEATRHALKTVLDGVPPDGAED